jgi:thymidylate synthase (FAD)
MDLDPRDAQVTLVTAPKVTLIAYPVFEEPEHLKVEVCPDDDGNFATDGEALVEYAGRICYMSQHNPAKRSTREYLSNVLAQGHGSIFEHANYTFLIEDVSRTLTHELVRHRAGFAYSQLSQRFVAGGGSYRVVVPPAIEADDIAKGTFCATCLIAARSHLALLSGMADDVIGKRRKEAARAVLPNCTATKIVVTANLRAWRGFIELRTTAAADQEIRRLAMAILDELAKVAPGAFSDYVTTVIPGAAASANRGITPTYRKV